MADKSSKNSNALDSIKKIYKDRVNVGTMPTLDGGTMSGAIVRPNSDTALVANKLTDSLGNKTYSVGYNNDNMNIPDIYKAVNTPIGTVDISTNDGQPNIGMSYSPNNNIGAITKGLLGAIANGGQTYNVGNSYGIHANGGNTGYGNYGEIDTPVGTIGGGYGGGYGANFTPNDTATKFLQLLSTLRR